MVGRSELEVIYKIVRSHIYLSRQTGIHLLILYKKEGKISNTVLYIKYTMYKI